MQDDESEEEELPKENKTLKLLQQELYASRNREEERAAVEEEEMKIVNESPKVALIETSDRRKSSDLQDWDRITSESQRAILSGAEPNSFFSKRDSKEEIIPEEFADVQEEILEI